MDHLLEVKNLTSSIQIDKKIFPIVNNLSFTLDQGQTVAIVGETGCGKSMTALSLMRILPTPPMLKPEGEVLYKGQNLLSLPEQEMQKIRGKRIGMIFQDPKSALNPVYTIGDQLEEMCAYHLHLEPEEALEKMIRALEEVQLPQPKQHLMSYPHQLSGGMLQRVMIAMALICDPDILIADEPTTALDVTIQAQILRLLHELQDKKGMATLLITHDMGVVAEMADNVIVMYAGEMIEQATVHALFENASHPYTQALFASRPEGGMTKGKLQTIQGSVPRITDLPGGCLFHPRCPYAMEMCQEKSAPLFELGKREQEVKCWLFDQELQWKIDHETLARD